MKNILSLVALMVLVSALGFGQTGSGTSAQALVTFSIGDEALLVEATDADWGVLSPGTVYTITADALITPVTPDGAYDVEPLYWTLTGAVGAPVEVYLTLPPYFQGEGGTGFARIPYSVNSTSAGWFNEDPGPEVAYQAFDPRVPYTVYLNGDGNAFIGLGGIVSVPTALSGYGETFEGVFILTAAYTGF